MFVHVVFSLFRLHSLFGVFHRVHAYIRKEKREDQPRFLSFFLKEQKAVCLHGQGKREEPGVKRR